VLSKILHSSILIETVVAGAHFALDTGGRLPLYLTASCGQADPSGSTLDFSAVARPPTDIKCAHEVQSKVMQSLTAPLSDIAAEAYGPQLGGLLIEVRAPPRSCPGSRADMQAEVIRAFTT
jgi:hypothetical protein